MSLTCLYRKLKTQAGGGHGWSYIIAKCIKGYRQPFSRSEVPPLCTYRNHHEECCWLLSPPLSYTPKCADKKGISHSTTMRVLESQNKGLGGRMALQQQSRLPY